MRKHILLRKVLFIGLFLVCLSPPCLAQYFGGSLESRIISTIEALVRIINIILVGVIAWAGFTLARGDTSGIDRLIYAIIGLIVINSSQLIINYFL